MRIINSIPQAQISVDEALSKGGMIVAVYQKKTSFLVSYSDDNIKYGYAFCSFGGGVHSASQSKRAAIDKNIPSKEVELHFFSTMAEFANAALANNWQL